MALKGQKEGIGGTGGKGRKRIPRILQVLWKMWPMLQRALDEGSGHESERMRRSLKQQKAQKDRDSTPMVKQLYSGPWKGGNAGC